MIKYYAVGIFKNAPHPFRQSAQRKHNPLQRLAYLFVLLVIGPTIWISGWLYLFYNTWPEYGLANLKLEWIAVAHASGAYMILIFLIVHVYLVTTGHTPGAQLKAMITGWEEVEDENEEKPKA
jgi:thiosulfate reductase cytochrome b subunit